MDVTAATPTNASEPAWPWVRWFTPLRCRLILIALITFGFVSHLHYLRNDCPIDLSGDEAQYWEWSRQLDLSYYSKGPLVAYIIRASTSVFGHDMWAVRLPAIVLASVTSLLTYWLTLRLFRSDRLALGAVLLNHLVPMFVAGSMLMTIDPPYFLCWGLATAFLALAALDNKPWAWAGVGVALGLGTLAKYGMLLWPFGMLIFLWVDRRRSGVNRLKTAGPWVAIGVGLLFLIPPIVWNAKHDWVTFKHVGTQTGVAKQKKLFDGNLPELVGGQIAAVGVALVPFIVGGIVVAWRRQKPKDEGARGVLTSVSMPDALDNDRESRAIALLMWMGLPLFALCVVMSVRSKMQVNWPAAAYFSWMILAAWFIATRLATRARWRQWWRGLFWGTVAFGVAFMPIAHDMSLAYPLMAKFGIEPRRLDLTVKMKGWAQLGRRLGRELKNPAMNEPFVLCEDYMQTAETAFYTPGNPITYCAGPYLLDPKRHTQFDIWPERRLDRDQLKGRDAIYVGYLDDEKARDGALITGNLRKAFDTIEELPEEPVVQRGLQVRRFKLYRCTNFKGMKMAGGASY
ncbi:MAG TPA: glycosyltransferase family 39 protein [Tepidisphaeraceae bacterium]|nr:glycosyltransferase family 39 protein [Tepidisphaeraceae bacterium]